MLVYQALLTKHLGLIFSQIHQKCVERNTFNLVYTAVVVGIAWDENLCCAEFLEMISRKFEIEKSFVINITENLKQEEFLTELMSE